MDQDVLYFFFQGLKIGPKLQAEKTNVVWMSSSRGKIGSFDENFAVFSTVEFAGFPDPYISCGQLGTSVPRAIWLSRDQRKVITRSEKELHL